MTRCAECVHWVIDIHDWEAKRLGFRLCVAVKGFEFSWFDENDPTEKAAFEAQKATLNKAMAYVLDSHRAELFTAPDFFCALFREADTSNTTPSGSSSDEPGPTPSSPA